MCPSGREMSTAEDFIEGIVFGGDLVPGRREPSWSVLDPTGLIPGESNDTERSFSRPDLEDSMLKRFRVRIKSRFTFE